MEWGSFVTTVIILYVAYYGLNYLYDIFLAGKPGKVETDKGIHYDMSDLMGEEEESKVMGEKDFEDPVVMPYAPSTEVEEDEPEPEYEAEPEHELEQEELQEEEEEERIEMHVQGQPKTVASFLETFKSEARTEAQVVFN